MRARTRFIVAQPVTFSAADPERREGLPAGVCACVEIWKGGGCVLCQTYVPQSPQTERCQHRRGEKRQNGEEILSSINCI